MRETNTKDLDTGQYDKKSYGLGVGFGVPMNEFDTVNMVLMLTCQKLNLLIHLLQRYKDYCKEVSGGDSSGCDQNEAVLSLDTLLIKEIVQYIQHLAINMILVLKLHCHCLICSIINLMQKLWTISH
jgi:outer membrane protein assembly factor BamA